ncbi:hypothetical protein LR48_Vigan09g102800 [Vigna angularis]|uniref:Uncharacterized protein n=1 Tax=Phaseolus angularis TaxID=3914 RepID=A0A0L9VCI8_PHAAN|nr:hypothetical protein LR48_Vigan09g102800 [Vigna angularis]
MKLGHYRLIKLGHYRLALLPYETWALPPYETWALPPYELGYYRLKKLGHYRPATVMRLIRHHSPWIIWKHPRLGPLATPHHMVQSSLHEKKDHWSFRMAPKTELPCNHSIHPQITTMYPLLEDHGITYMNHTITLKLNPRHE